MQVFISTPGVPLTQPVGVGGRGVSGIRVGNVNTTARVSSDSSVTVENSAAYSHIATLHLGAYGRKCKHCSALYFDAELETSFYGFCCQKGQVQIPPLENLLHTSNLC